MGSRYLTAEFWQHLAQETTRSVTSSGVHILVVLALYFAAQTTLNRLIDATLTRLVAREGAGRQGERAARLLTLQGLVKSIVGYVLFFVAAVMVVDALGVNVTGLLTTAGIGGLAIGFGAQRLVRDVISGFFLIMEDQFAVGDYVTIGPATGVVVELGMRITRLHDDLGRVWVLANGDISAVTNHSRGPTISYVDVSVPIAANLARAREAIDAVGRDLHAERPSALLEPPGVMGVAAFDSAQTTLRVGLAADPRTVPVEQLRLRDAIRARFVEEGILSRPEEGDG
ncbi:MAG: mechanosensitive ion channel family protein [Chthonomonadales bacterium]|nr:mechanosensitive ion channel family protein [Chthonomonadales bacterium]